MIINPKMRFNTTGSQSFARQREKIYARYHKGFEEYRKSEYFKDRASTARDTASMDKFNDKGYLDRRIKECQKEIRQREKNLISYENTLYSIENGENPTKWNGTAHTAEEVTGWLNRELELIEVALDKEGFYLNCLDDLGGVAFSQSNVEIGYLVVLDRWGLVEVVGRGSKNITYPHNESSLYVDTLYIENIPNKKSFVHYMDFNNK